MNHDPEVQMGTAERITAAVDELKQLLVDTDGQFAGSGDVQDAIVSLEQGARRLTEQNEQAAMGDEARAGAGAAAEVGDDVETA